MTKLVASQLILDWEGLTGLGRLIHGRYLGSLPDPVG